MKKSIKFIFCLPLVSCFAWAASSAYAEPRAHGEHMYDSMHKEAMDPGHESFAERHFKEMDSNGDGVVSKSEYDAAHDKHFKELDTNGDGKLTLEEMKAGHKETLNKAKDRHFDEADTNHDGALTREEARKMPMLSRHFDEIDANKDGKVTREELDAAMEKMHKRREHKQSDQE